MFFPPAAQFAYRKGLGYTDALLTISDHLQKTLNAWMQSYIVQLDFSAAFDGMSHRGLLFKMKSIGVGGSVLFICRAFLADRGTSTSEWTPIVSGVPLSGKRFGSSSVHPIYRRNV